MNLTQAGFDLPPNRWTFPCFDEPSFRSTFSTTLVKPAGDEYIALSNHDVQEISSVT